MIADEGGRTMPSDDDDDDLLHAFVFVTHTDDPSVNASGLVTKLAGLKPSSGQVRWAGAFVGDYIVLAHIQAVDLDHLQTFIEGELWDTGVRCSFGVEVAKAGKGTKRSTPEFIALVSMLTERGLAYETLEWLQEHRDDIGGFKGASLLLGDVDILLQLGAETFEELRDAIVAFEGQDIPGIVSTSSSIGNGSRSAFA
jgi:hypothetical protein